MAITINDGLQNNSPKPLEAKTGIFASGVFRAYTSVAEANATISSSFRTVGLTVLVNLGGGAGNQEFWYKNGILDANLIPKSLSPNVTQSSASDFSMILPAGYLLWGFVLKCSTIATVSIGTTSGNSDIANAVDLVAGVSQVTEFSQFLDNSTTVFVSGVSSSTGNLTITPILFVL